MADDRSREELFLGHLDRLTGGAEPQFASVESTTPDLPGVTAIAYDDLPEPGHLVGITYGLSLAEHEAWLYGKPELCICVRSEDRRWALAVAYLAEVLRGRAPFSYGDLLELGEPISPESEMDGFVVFAPAVLEEADAAIDLGEELPVHLMGVYPTYESERTFIDEQGLEAFWKLDWDPYDVTRPPAA
ncbi:suppressor of fused domain protein [Nocardioides sp. SYSU DS0651]|uniref:suppressor of fused domain protein n=1 Tax=Nocardioides sp. SYSU DS0651 TaxID=3415955 RepID=UPI003F4C43DD